MTKLKRKDYEEQIERLQHELVGMARWLQASGQRMVVLLEGRDTAGKGGVINAIADHMNPRQCRVVALPKPTERESSQWYFQRYIAHLPAAGEMVLFDRSWYNRAGVEKVMGFASDAQVKAFLRQTRRSSSCWSTTASCCSSTGCAAIRTSRRNASPNASRIR